MPKAPKNSEQNHVKALQKMRDKHVRAFNRETVAYLARVKKQIVEAYKQHNEGFVLANLNEYLKDETFKDAIIKYDIQNGVDNANLTREYILQLQKTKRENPLSNISISFFSERWKKQMQEYAISASSKLITKINATTRGIVQNILSKTVTQGATKTARELSKSVAFSKSRALTIARTEMAAASEQGSYIAATEFSTKLKKKWLIASNARDRRPAHVALNGMEVRFNETFNVNGIAMKYPHDEAGGAEENINCQCTCLYVPDRTIETATMADLPQILNTQKPMQGVSSLGQTIRDLFGLATLVGVGKE